MATLDICDTWEAYYIWLCEIAMGTRYSDCISYSKLLGRLYGEEFTFSLDKDLNRASDGITLRHRFALRVSLSPEDEDDMYDTPCSILEMIIALALRMEEQIMDDPVVGDRSGQWFWGMIVNLGLGSMTDDRYDETYVTSVINRFLNRDYEPDGRGGLFRVRHSQQDLRDVEIWTQMCWYLNELLGL